MLLRRPQAAGASTTAAEWTPMEVGDGLRVPVPGQTRCLIASFHTSLRSDLQN